MPARKTRPQRKALHAEQRTSAHKAAVHSKTKPRTTRKTLHAEAVPGAGRPVTPRSYAIKKTRKGTLAWTWANERLSNAHNYWVATTRPDRRPHVMPVWGVWVRHQFCFGTDPQSAKGRNLSANPFAVVHLESGDEAVIVEGRVEMVQEEAFRKEIARAYYAKYKVHFAERGSEPVYAVRPRVAFAWQEKSFTASATRWKFEG